MSASKRWQARYRAQKEADSVIQECMVCHRTGNKSTFSPHHLQGRSGENILNYRYVCEIPCHRMIHANPAWAKEKGYLHTRK